MHSSFHSIAFLRTSFPSPFLARLLSCCSISLSAAKSEDLYEYTSGKWLWNDAFRHAERRRTFNPAGLKELAAAAVDRPSQDVTRFEKLAEGGFDRTFLVSMRDGFQLVARIPYSITEPQNLLIASEVATMDYLRARDIPVPKVYGYSTDAENLAGTEYIIMEAMRGKNLGDLWYQLGEKARIAVVERLVELESRLFSLDFPASGSLFHTSDLGSQWDQVPIPLEDSKCTDTFSIGPDLTLSMWYGRRQDLDVSRGPYRDVQEMLAAGARKEITYLEKHGRPLHPLQRLRRECFDFQRQSHSEHADLLRDYLLTVESIAPRNDPAITQPKLRHPDLQPNNIFVSDNLEITGLIDWQHSTILPLFLQGGIPGSLQNYGDEVSESLEMPILPDEFDDLDENSQMREVELLRKRQLYYHYVQKTMNSGSPHSKVLTDPLCVLRRKLLSRAGQPWEGDNVTLKADLIEFAKAWPLFAPSQPGTSVSDCPIRYTEAEQQECADLETALEEADSQFRTCLNLVGAGPEGWVPLEIYDEAQARAEQLLIDTLEHAESDGEREEIREHWIFADFDETEYY